MRYIWLWEEMSVWAACIHTFQRMEMISVIIGSSCFKDDVSKNRVQNLWRTARSIENINKSCSAHRIHYYIDCWRDVCVAAALWIAISSLHCFKELGRGSRSVRLNTVLGKPQTWLLFQLAKVISTCTSSSMMWIDFTYEGHLMHNRLRGMYYIVWGYDRIKLSHHLFKRNSVDTHGGCLSRSKFSTHFAFEGGNCRTNLCQLYYSVWFTLKSKQAYQISLRKIWPSFAFSPFERFYQHSSSHNKIKSA